MRKKLIAKKKAILKHTRYDPKMLYKIVYPSPRIGDYTFCKSISSAKTLMKTRLRKFLRKNIYLTAILYKKGKKTKGFYKWHRVGVYGYSPKTNKFMKRGK